MPLAILVRSAAQTDPPRGRLLVRDRCVSDHVQSTSGKLSISPARVARVAARSWSQDGMGSFEVEESLSIGGNASNGFVDHAKRIFHRC